MLLKPCNLDLFLPEGSRWTSMMSSSRESSVTRNIPTARSNSRPFHDKTFEKQDRSAGVGTEMYKAITATQVSFFAACLHPFYFFSFKIVFTMSLEFLIHYFSN